MQQALSIDRRSASVSRFFQATGLLYAGGSRWVRGLLTLTAVAALVFLAGCGATGVNLGNFNLISSAQEVQMGDSLSIEVEKEYPILKNEAVAAYVNEVGQKVVSICDRRDIPYYFKVVADREQVNAFALPGGRVYVYEGLLLQASNEAELAAVLAHEIGHVVARHATKQLTKQYGYSLLVSLILGEQPGRWSGLAANIFGTAGLLKFSRDDEYEADRLAVVYSNAAGYAPRAVADFLGKLATMEGREPGKLESLLMTHPPTSERIGRVKAEISALPSPSTGIFAERYLSKISSIRK